MTIGKSENVCIRFPSVLTISSFIRKGSFISYVLKKSVFARILLLSGLACSRPERSQIMISPQNSNNPNVVYESASGQIKEKKAAFSMGKVLKWLSLGIGVTGVVAIALSDIFAYWLSLGRTDEVSTARTACLILSLLVRIPSGLIIAFNAFSKRMGLRLTGYLAYAISMGTLLGSVFLSVMLAVETPTSYIWVLSLAFLSTAALFLLFGIIADHVSKHIPRLLVFVRTAGRSLLILSLVNIFLNLGSLYWGIERGCLFLRLIVTAIDRANVKRLAESKGFTNVKNRSIYCAYQLYVDFIWIFLRLLIIIASASLRNRN